MEHGDDEYFMRMALAEAQKAAERDEVPVGVVIVAGKIIISRAHNLTETLNDPTAHAEMQAITAAASYLGGKYLTDCTIYVTVEPCIMCAGALAWSQVSAIVYGASDEKKGYTTTGP
jgi:tRNA(adenine34) deaminase